MTFHVGQKVVCVDAKDTKLVRLRSVYTVTKVLGVYLELAGIHGCTGVADGMLATRFRPVVERKTDISVFHEILRTTKARETVALCSHDGGARG